MWAIQGVKRNLRMLDFDIETRPLSFWTDGNPTSEITAIGSAWIGETRKVETFLLGRHSPEEMLQGFLERYNQADIVVGHYIRGFDLPTINGALMEYGMPQLGPKMVQDTYLDLHKKKGIPGSQGYLGELLDVGEPKVQMSQYKWRKSNRLSPEGILEAENRVRGDVRQNMLLREVMVEARLLKPPSMWYP